MKRLIPVSLFALLLAAGCMSSNPNDDVTSGTAMAHGPMAMAMLSPTTNQTARGMVHFTELGDGAVRVDVDLTNVPPGTHGFHVHEKGDCGNDAQNAGGHFNPLMMPHGGPDADAHHAGDFGNVTADAAGNVKMSFTTHSITVGDGPKSVVGHAIVLHGNADDLKSQPAGNAGPRIACGVAEAMAGMQH